MNNFFTSIRNGAVAAYSYVKSNAWVRYVGTLLAGFIIGLIF